MSVEALIKGWYDSAIGSICSGPILMVVMAHQGGHKFWFSTFSDSTVVILQTTGTVTKLAHIWVSLLDLYFVCILCQFIYFWSFFVSSVHNLGSDANYLYSIVYTVFSNCFASSFSLYRLARFLSHFSSFTFVLCGKA